VIPHVKSQPGTYVLVLRSRAKRKARVGRWGHLHVIPGYYIYVGSAFGPGGVRARVSRHCRQSKPKRWHIDYLCEFLRPIEVWCSYETARVEHPWAQVFSDMASMLPIQGFGCSDCKCFSHLFFTSREPDLAPFSKIVGGEVESWPVSTCRLTAPSSRR
jgi:Uri superfamily endonuclease